MSEVKRYDIYSDGFDNFSISEDEAGRYVSLEDYATLQQRLDASTRLADACKNAEMVWEKTMMEAIGEDGPACVSKAIAALKSDRDAVVAENAAIKSPEMEEFLRLVECMNGDHIDANYGHSHEWIRHIVAQQGEFEEKHGDTPWAVVSGSKYIATDAILNSVRAEGVELVKAHPAISLCSLTHVCEEIANQLRTDATKGGSDD